MWPSLGKPTLNTPFVNGIMEKGLEIEAREAEFRHSSTTSQLSEFGQVTASLTLCLLMYQLGLNKNFNIIK